jgi:signal transduction histidine kinase
VKARSCPASGDAVDLLAAALRDTADGVAIVDGDGRLVFVNPALASVLDGQAAAATSQLLADVVDVVGAEVADVVGTALTHGRWSGEVRARPPAVGLWEVTLTRVATTGNAVVGLFRDVREKRELEQFRADFLSTVTHDIRSPLTVILGYTELLGEGKPPAPEMLTETILRIRESGEQIHALVSNFLELSRIEAGRLVLDRRPIDLDELVTRAVEQHTPRANRKGVALTLEPGLLPPVVVDRPQMERVFANVLGNAVKYTPSGGRITVTTGHRSGHALIAVQDTGPGISSDEMPHIFEKYRRARAMRRVEGTGLGLFIAKTIAAAHGGDIHVDSAPGIGSTFTVLVPAA